ncbi:MAG: glycosyltransferase [Paenibacillus sp.]|nr:glycosyltransferase [Paenibacillus sp.]
MNIAYAYADSPIDLNSGSHKRYSESLANLLVRQEGEYLIHHYERAGVEQVDGFDEMLGGRRAHLEQFLQQACIDIMHIVFPDEDFFRLVNRGWLRNTKLVVTLNDTSLFATASPYSEQATAFINCCDLIVVHSEQAQADVTELTGLPNERVLLLSQVLDHVWGMSTNRADAAHMAAAYRKLIRKKLAVFAPLSSNRSSEVHYMAMLAPHLSDAFECHFYTGDAYSEDLRMDSPDQIKQFPHTDYAEHAHQYHMVLYQLGNGRVYHYMLPYMRQFPGVVVVHDLASNLHAWRDYLLSARLLIVHSRPMVRKLEQMGASQIYLCNRPVKIPVMITLLTEHNFVFTSFTSNLTSKGLELVLRCLRRMIDQGYTDIQYMIVNESDSQSRDELYSLITNLALSSHVSLISRTEGQYSSLISRSNVGITLREYDESEDEFDEVILDLLAQGKPSIVPETSVYEPFPDELVWQIAACSDEEERLFEVMQKLYLNKELRKKIRKQARGYMSASYTVPRYANELTGQISRVIGSIEPHNRISSPVERPEQAYANMSDTEVEARAEAEAEADIEADNKVEVGVAPVLATEVIAENLTPATKPPFENSMPITKATPQPKPTIFVLYPNRFGSRKNGKMPAKYCSFNLEELPKPCTIMAASMHIPMASRKILRVYRIRSGWSAKGLSRKRPRAAKLPLFKSLPDNITVHNGLQYKWNCKELVRVWRGDSGGNHGVLIPFGSSIRRPSLVVEVKYEN